MKAKVSFDGSLDEVVFLNETAQKDDKHDQIYFKVIVLLLCAKLEKYVKDSAKEYIDELIDLKLTKDKLPDKFVLQILKNELEKIRESTVEQYVQKEHHRESARNLSLIWDSKYVCKGLVKDEFTVSISNNGTTAFEDAYKKIGFPDVIKNMNDYVIPDDNKLTQTAVSVKDQINKIILLRHNIIHDDASPQLAVKDINLFVNISRFFVTQIDGALSAALAELKAK